MEPSKNKRQSVNNSTPSISEFVAPADKSAVDDLEVSAEVIKQDFCIPTVERSEAAPSPITESLRTEDMTTPESSLTNLIRDMKSEVAKEKRTLPKEPLPKELLSKEPLPKEPVSKDAVPVTTFIETVDAAEYEEDMDHLIIEEDSLEPVMCCLNNDGLVPYDCKTISPAPSNHDEFEIPEILDDIINTIYSDPPVFDKK